jgi:anti-sigma factor RsiW
MKCKDAYIYICDNLDADLNSPECREIRKHLVDCPDCTAYLDSLKKTVHLYRTAPVPEVTPAIHSRLFKIIKLNPATPAKPRKRATR